MLATTLVISLSVGLGVDKGLEALQGTWRVEKLTARGKEVPPEKAKAITFVIERDAVKRLVNGVDRKDPATLKVDASKKPAQIDLVPAKEGDPTMLGIYELDGDTLRWCFSAKKRPAKFEAPTGGDATLLILKRVKE
jgi:uncharacterized protein (TIGR03067 family)